MCRKTGAKSVQKRNSSNLRFCCYLLHFVTIMAFENDRKKQHKLHVAYYLLNWLFFVEFYVPPGPLWAPVFDPFDDMFGALK